MTSSRSASSRRAFTLRTRIRTFSPSITPRYEAGHPVDTTNPLTAEGNIMDFEFQFLTWTNSEGGIGLGHSASLDGWGGAGQNKNVPTFNSSIKMILARRRGGAEISDEMKEKDIGPKMLSTAVLKNGIIRCVNGLEDNFSAPPRLRAKISPKTLN